VNLQLIQPEESRKVALNDNLVTFSGKFRERQTEEGKNRYKYLELLNGNHELKIEDARLKNELKTTKVKVDQTGALFLQMSGQSLPKGGFVIVDDLYNTPNEDNSIIVTSVPSSNVESLARLKEDYQTVQKDPKDSAVKELENGIHQLVRGLRSPTFGIGSESIKQTLRTIDQDLTNAASLSIQEKLQISLNSLDSLQSIFTELDQVEDHVRLSKLRSVRSYKELLDENSQINNRLDDNQIQLDKARQSVANVIWYFNNQELSTRSLEKQDPEVFGQWFTKAKEEWTNFNHNRGGIFRAPDQPLNTVMEKSFKSEEPTTNYFSYLFSFMPILLVLFVLWMIFSKQMKGMGNTAMNFGKSPAKLMNKGENKITFKDVAGVDEALEELQEIVEFLKNPQKFTILGGTSGNWKNIDCKSCGRRS
jgi:cell division protease FtsH